MEEEEEEEEERWRPSTCLWGEEDQLEVSRVLVMGQGVVRVKAIFCIYPPVGGGEGGAGDGSVHPPQLRAHQG